MSFVSAVVPGGPSPVKPLSTRCRAAGGHTPRMAVEWPVDAFETSGRPVNHATARLDGRRMHEIRQQIAAGTYLTDDKLNVVFDRLSALLKRGRNDSERATA